jgi:hypothetical protein
MVSGRLFKHQRPREANPAAQEVKVQDELLSYCAGLTGVKLPR